MKNKILSTILVALLTAAVAQAAPKKLLVVTTTTGFRHSSIPTLEKVITQLGASSGEFTADFVHQPPGKPRDLQRNATPEAKAAHDAEEKAWEETLKTALLKLSPESLKNYDAVVFASTTGDLPIPDKEGFLNWIKAGHAFIGIHAGSDTFHGWPGYIDMLGGEFDHHEAQLSVDCLNVDPANPATATVPKVWTVTLEEVYQFKNYDQTKVHDLLIMDKQPDPKVAVRPPGHYAVSWCKDYGTGRVFYTSLGHREDVIDTDPNIRDRKNDVETVSKVYQAHLLGGIEWALGLKK
jgi:type 1 glutamine amidotransferase